MVNSMKTNGAFEIHLSMFIGVHIDDARLKATLKSIRIIFWIIYSLQMYS